MLNPLSKQFLIAGPRNATVGASCENLGSSFGAGGRLAEKLRTPLQLDLTFEAAFRAGAKPVPVKTVDGALAAPSTTWNPALFATATTRPRLCARSAPNPPRSGAFWPAPWERIGLANSPATCAPRACPCDRHPPLARSVSTARRLRAREQKARASACRHCQPA